MLPNYQVGKELYDLHKKRKSKLSNLIEGSLYVEGVGLDLGNITLDGNIYVGINANVIGNINGNANLNISGNSILDNLLVNNSTTLNGLVNINNDVNIDGLVHIINNLTLDKNLLVNGISLFKDDTRFNSNSIVTFDNPPIFSGNILEIINNNQLTTKEYVDESIRMNLTWWDAVEMFWDFSEGNPPDLLVDKRYISATTYNTFTENYVYQYDGLIYDEIIPKEGVILYCKSGTIHEDETIVYTSDNIWVNAGYSIKGLDHESLSNINKTALDHKTHEDIDNHISNSTTAHFGQELTTSGDIEFNTLVLTNTIPLISDYTLNVNGNVNITNNLDVLTISCPIFSYTSKDCLIDVDDVQTSFSIYSKIVNNSINVLIPSITLTNIPVPLDQIIILRIISETGILFNDVIFIVPNSYLITIKDTSEVIIYKKYCRIYYISNELHFLNDIGEPLKLDVVENNVNISIEEINLIGIINI